MMRRLTCVAICLWLAACSSVPQQAASKSDGEALTLDVTDPYRFFTPDKVMTPRQYVFQNYNAFFESYVNNFQWRDLPSRLQWKWRACIVGYSMTMFTENEWWELSAFAWGQTKLTAGELADFHHRKVKEAALSDAELMTDIRDYCPDTVQALMPYVQQGRYATIFGR